METAATGCAAAPSANESFDGVPPPCPWWLTVDFDTPASMPCWLGADGWAVACAALPYTTSEQL